MKLDHGAIGNGRVIALVGPDTSIDWLCLPRFDSPSIFARLLDEERGGSFAFEPMDLISSSMAYLRNTNVLRTEVITTQGRYEVVDFAPRLPTGLSVDAPPRFTGWCGRSTGRPDPGPLRSAAGLRPRRARDHPRGTGHRNPRRGHQHLSPHQRAAALSRARANHPGRSAAVLRAERGARHDLRFIGRGHQRDGGDGEGLAGLGPHHRAAVVRAGGGDASALCLKLHAYNDTGAIIAAATTSVPEAVGTERTWDYRFCWLRDAAFVVEALRRLGHLGEGEAFVRFLRDVAEAGPLQPLYGIGGERELTEERLDHLAGFEGTQPVRVGNAAYTQVQTDLMGEMVLCLETLLTDPRVVHEDPTSWG